MYVADASYFVGLADREDRWHRDSVRVKGSIPQRFIVSDLVLAEAVTIVGARLGGRQAQVLYQYFLDACDVVYTDEKFLEDAMASHLHYGGRLSVADCMSLAIMARRGIEEIVSFDADFDRVKGIARVH